VTNGHISQEDLILHALQALPVAEDSAIAAHLAQCVACRGELASISGELALVALSVDQQPVPAGARSRFLAQIASPRGDSSARANVPRHKMPRSFWVAWLAVAALLLISVRLGIEIQRLDLRLQKEEARTARLTADKARAQDVLDVLTAPASQHVLLTAAKNPPAPTGRAVYLAARGGLIFEASNLRQIAPDKTYELWVIPANGSAPIPAGLFRPDAAGNASVVLPPLAPGVPAKALGVTIEKAAGAETPTAPILLSGAAGS
jgi:anti-sigma factor RsiW